MPSPTAATPAAPARASIESKPIEVAPTTQTKATTRADNRCIRVRGAREHNLKDISLEIPRDKLVVMTGLSGSGKSSLAFDTIFAEGQRKYMESLSAYARQFLDQLKKPDVDEVEGIPPTIAIEQRSSGSNPRSTVATTTEIYDYLRLLFARCGTPYSWASTKLKKDGSVLERSGRRITATSATQIVDALLAPGRGQSGPTRAIILAPVVRGRKGFHRDVLEDLSQQGWTRARVNGEMKDLREVLKEPGENPLKLGRHEKHTIEAVIDRLTLDTESRQRIAESVESAIRIASGIVVVSSEGPDGAFTDRSFSTKFADPDNPEVALEELEPRLFSFNSPFGACPSCNGLGTLMELDENLVLPNDAKSLREGAIAAYAKNVAVKAWFGSMVKKFCAHAKIDYDLPVATFKPEQRKMLLYGIPKDSSLARRSNGKVFKWSGVIPGLHQWWQSTQNETVKEWLNQFMSDKPCPTCHGDRLRLEALHVLIESEHAVPAEDVVSANVIGRPGQETKRQRDEETKEKNSKEATKRGSSTPSLRHSVSPSLHFLNIAEFSRLDITEAVAFVSALKLTEEQRTIAAPILKEINNRLRFLAGVGLEYLNLSRKTATLSGGEAQRIRLASQVGSGLVGACYVLDEPTIGLHQRDNDRLIATLRHLSDIGNTVLVVEHDEDMIRHADHVVDIGPGPGVHGGRVVAQGTVADIIATKGSITGDYLSGRRKIETPAKRRPVTEKHAITIKGARENNLKNVDAAFPLGGLICVTGVSGSGKSTLVNEILLKGIHRELGLTRELAGAHETIKLPKPTKALPTIDRIIEVDQTPIGRTPRSNPATYVGFFDEIRKVFVATKESKVRGYKPGRFSFNVTAQNGGGRCEACQGQGLKKIEMHFLPDVFVECEVCRGKRYNRETLEVTYRGKNISDVLDMTIENAIGFFENHPKVQRALQCLHDVGLDYLTLGQPSTQLSGGEAQRIKLATELARGTSIFGGWDGLKQDDLAKKRAATNTGDDAPGEDSDEADETITRARSPRALGPSAHTLYILDEPTTGLHFEDINKLVQVLHRLADAGNTLVVIEHNLDVIKCADWLIDLGPEGGDNGGQIIAKGTPEDVAKVEKSYTGKYLKPLLQMRR
ncbi:MAG TPA: excinuclease ABC subunit A [Phycisphaerales bacterium]|nr:excinuclease ABC subunit A [Phycisphaerales bacterium]